MEQPYDPAGDLSQSGNTPVENEEEEELAVQQTTHLRRFRFFFTLAILVIALGLASGIYALTKRQEKDAFKSAFDDRAQKIADTIHVRVGEKVAALQSFSFDITSFVNFNNNLNWPYVTIPDFDIKAASVRSLAQSVSLMLYSRVDQSDLSAWGDYASKNSEWVTEGLIFQNTNGQAPGTTPGNTATLSPENSTGFGNSSRYVSYIDSAGNRVPVSGSGLFYPAWQISPVTTSLINLDLHSSKFFAVGIDAVEQTNEAFVGTSEMGSALDGTLAAFRDSWETSNSPFYQAHGPVNMLFFPVFSGLNASRDSVGQIVSVAFWQSFMDQVLPPGQGGLYSVVSNLCAETYTYVIHGDTVRYMGPGDLHNPDYNNMQVSQQVFDLAAIAETKRGIPLNDVCNYTVTLYPTSDLESQFVTATPWLFFGLVLAIFILTTIIIYLYDWKVEKNYQETYRKAKQASAIVSSIFPAAVRKRLYEDDANAKMKGHGGFKQAVPLAVDSQKTRLKGFLSEDTPAPGSNGRGSAGEELADAAGKNLDKAIADLFPNTTILFADIVGFTPWSSQR